jgi:hypothetical protein
MVQIPYSRLAALLGRERRVLGDDLELRYSDRYDYD